MKKIVLVTAVIILSSILSIIVCASYMDTIQAIKVQYPIIMNGKETDKDVPMVSIEDRVYLPIRAMCEVLGIEIAWKEEGRVEITKNRVDAENDRIEMGHYDIGGWKKVDSVDFEMTKETALAIANDIFLQVKGKEFLLETFARIDEIDNGTCYSIYRYTPPMIPGGELSIIIRKSDGKILRMVAGE